MLAGLNNYIYDENDADECVRAWHIELWVLVCGCVCLRIVIVNVEGVASTFLRSFYKKKAHKHQRRLSPFSKFICSYFLKRIDAPPKMVEIETKSNLFGHFCSMRFSMESPQMERERREKSETMKERASETTWKWSTRLIPTTSLPFFFLLLSVSCKRLVTTLKMFASTSIACDRLCASE